MRKSIHTASLLLLPPLGALFSSWGLHIYEEALRRFITPMPKGLLADTGLPFETLVFLLALLSVHCFLILPLSYGLHRRLPALNRHRLLTASAIGTVLWMAASLILHDPKVDSPGITLAVVGLIIAIPLLADAILTGLLLTPFIGQSGTADEEERRN
ncbi:MAG: hypothetical protein ACYTGH_12975 [Planctomycetota bacterium]